jgi:protein-disulfide isomerase
MSGVRSGVNGTPSFYVNGAKYDGDYSLEALVAELERAATA